MSQTEHDLLCPMAGQTSRDIYLFGIPCECDLIARVRADERRKASEEVERLTRWKAEAIEVLDAWEEVWKALGSPGGLGESKARASRAKAAELMAGGAS